MKNLLSRLPIIATLVTFAAIVIMFALGIWQLQRAEEKTLRLESIKRAAMDKKISLQDVVDNITNSLDMHVSFDAEPDPQHYFLIDNKINKGRVGYQVLVPLNTKYGLLMTNYGWVSATNSRQTLPNIRIEKGKSTFTGMVAIPTHNTMVKETAIVDGQWPKVLQQIDLKMIQKHHHGEQVLPFIVQLNEDTKSSFVREWQPVVMPPEKHIAYAIQWFLLAFSAAVIFVVAHRSKFKRNSSEHN